MELTQAQYDDLMSMIRIRLNECDLSHIHGETIGSLDLEYNEEHQTDNVSSYNMRLYRYLRNLIKILRNQSSESYSSTIQLAQRYIQSDGYPIDGIRLGLNKDLSDMYDTDHVELEKFPDYANLIKALEKISFQFG